MTQTMAAVPVELAVIAMRILVLAVAAGVALAAFHVRATALRLMAWKGVLYAALAMPLLTWMLPPLSVPLPGFVPRQRDEFSASLPKENAHTIATRFVTSARTNDSIARELPAETPGGSFAHRTGSQAFAMPAQVGNTDARPEIPVRRTISWSATAVAIYLFAALVLLGRMVVGLIFSHRLVRTSAPVLDPRVISRASTRQGALYAEVVESGLVSVPVTIGILGPTIVLPTDWRAWEDAKLGAVLAHELSHVVRRDPLTQLFSLLHRAIFWFSPLAWWLDRHLADLAEQASDEAALSCGANRTDYARTLLGFFEALHAAPGRVWWQGVSMAKTGQAEKRLERILAWKGKVTMSLKKSVIAGIFALAIPAAYLTATVHAASPQDAQIPPPARPSAAPAPAAVPVHGAGPNASPLPAAAPVAPRTTITGVIAPAPLATIYPPVPAAVVPAPVAPTAPPAAWLAQSRSYGSGRSYSAKGHSYAFGYDDDQRFVIVSGNSDSMTMSGDSEDIHHVQRLKKQISGDFIWFSRDEKSYIIRDQATVARARAFWAPQEELGKKQEELGKRQEELGRQQEALGKKQEEVRVKVPDNMTADLDRLKAKLQKLGPTATVEQLGELQSEIGELQSKIGDIQSAAGVEQGKLGEEQGALGEKQGQLGEEQGKLGEEQGRLAEKASRQMKELLDESLKNGKAQPEPQSDGGNGTL